MEKINLIGSLKEKSYLALEGQGKNLHG